MSRKTINVDQLTDWVNTRLAVNSTSLVLDGLTAEQAFRLGVASLLEQVLHATDNYKGFNYQESEVRPDWYFNETDSDGKQVSPLRPGYDDTRRYYYKTDGSH